MRESIIQKPLRKLFRVRPAIVPNLGFWRQMIEWETEHNGGKATVNLVPMEGMKRPVPDVYQSSDHLPIKLKYSANV